MCRPRIDYVTAQRDYDTREDPSFGDDDGEAEDDRDPEPDDET